MTFAEVLKTRGYETASFLTTAALNRASGVTTSASTASTVAAMTGFAALIGRLADRSAEKGTRAYQRLLGVLGVLAIAVGIVWLLP